MKNQEANHSIAPARHRLWLITLPLAVIILLGANGFAQGDEPPLPVDPTPLEKLVTQQERDELADSRDPKKMVETCLKISDAHLDLGYALTKEGKIGDAERELDIFNKASLKASEAAFSHQKSRRGLFKKIEQRLYKHIRTLDNMVRLFPPERLAFVAAALNRAKQLRIRALNETFAAGDILDDPSKDKEKKPDNDGSREDGSLTKSPRLTGSAGLMRLPGRSFAPPASFVSFAPSQFPGDYLTEEEDDLVRQAQKADDRIKVFMKIADRRVAALTGTGADSQLTSADKKVREKADKEVRNWGALPKLSRVQLLQHYAKTIDEAMAKLEDAHERNPKSSALPKALESLRDATERHLQVLRSLESEMKGESEELALNAAIGRAEQANQGAKEGLKQQGPGAGDQRPIKN